jgi:tetratricopeptide (TPR) repeat protein
VASLELTSKAAGLLDRGRPDEAIRVLERALGLNPESARAYYQMARAWKQKGDFSQALEYNRMAAMYPAGDREWAEKIRGQRRRILERKGAD